MYTKSIIPIYAVVAALGLLMPTAAFGQAPRLNLNHLDRLAARASQVVDVNVDAAMLEQTAGFFARKNANDPKLKRLIEDIRGIYVKAFEFRTEGAKDVRPYSDSDIEEIRKQLTAPGWTRLVSVREEGELAEVYFWKEGAENGGLAIIAAEAHELVVVNIVGRVNIATLAALGPMVPKLPAAASRLLKK